VGHRPAGYAGVLAGHETTDGREAMSLVKIPFKPYFKEPLLNGVKTCTARTKRMGEPGDTFMAFGASFELVSVEEVRLYEVASLWKEEGCTSEEDFKGIWETIHPRTGYSEYHIVKLHRFKMVMSECAGGKS
jgi:hypothetical protein